MNPYTGYVMFVVNESTVKSESEVDFHGLKATAVTKHTGAA